MSVRGFGIRRFRVRRDFATRPRAAAAGTTIAQPPRWTAATSTYIICTNPRSGSWLLSESLASTSLAGNPREWFNIFEEQQHRAVWRMDYSTDLTFPAYIDLARTKSTTSNGISGIKLHCYQFEGLIKKLAAIEGLRGLGEGQLMSKVFPNARYIWLTRRDKVRQAISLELASSTDEWWVIEGAVPNKRKDRTGEPEFDPHEIGRREAALVENDSKWQTYFQDNGIEPLVIHYEDLAADYSGAIVSVLKWLGIPNADSIMVPPPRLRRQSNARNEEWLSRYMAFKKEGAQPSQDPASASPATARFQKPLEAIPDAWKQWVGQGKLLKTKDEAIVEVLTGNGYSRAAALGEVENAASDPYLLGAAHTGQRLKKGAWLLNALGELSRLDSKAQAVERRSAPSRDEFRDRYYAANRPVVIEGLMTDWRAITAWTPDYLKSVAGDRTVEVMTGRDADPKYEMKARKHRAELRFSDYIDMVYSGKVTNDYYLVPNNAFFEKPGMQALLSDFSAFPEYLKQTAACRQCFLWFGPAGTVTPLHFEPSNILMAQVAGRKRYRLIPSTQSQYVYNSEGVFSDVDCENPDLNRYPKFRHTTIIDIVVKPGDVLFVPVGWWHHVRALDVSMTVSFTNFVFPNYYKWEQ